MVDSQKGFIQIPILIAIIASILAVGSVGYIVIDTYRESDTNENLNVSIEQINAELETIKQSTIEKASKGDAAPIVIQATPDPALIRTTPVVEKAVVAKETGNLCADIRGEFDAFEKKYNTIVQKAVDAIQTHTDAHTTNSADLYGLGYFKYLYSQASSKKDIFSQKLADLKELVFELPALSKDVGNLSILKEDFSRMINAYSYSYNLRTEAYKKVTEDQYNSTIDAAKQGIKSAQESSTEGYNLFLGREKHYAAIKINYDNALKKERCKGFCDGGFALSSLSGVCVRMSPVVRDVSPFSGSSNSVFVITGNHFGDKRESGDTVWVGGDFYEPTITSWTNTEIKFIPSGLAQGATYPVTLKKSFTSKYAGQIKIH